MVKIKSFAQDHRNLANYKKIFNDSTHFTIEVQSARGDVLIARVEGVNDRNAAEALAQTRLYIDREELSPTKQNEFYISDLIGMEVVDTHNSDVGIVAGVHNFGGGDIVEVQLIDQSKRMLLFNTEKLSGSRFDNKQNESGIFKAAGHNNRGIRPNLTPLS